MDKVPAIFTSLRVASGCPPWDDLRGWPPGAGFITQSGAGGVRAVLLRLIDLADDREIGDNDTSLFSLESDRHRMTEPGKYQSKVAGEQVSLPVLSPQIRKSKNAPRRAAVLILVQLLIIAHVIQWWLTGSTLSPIEPSEAMEFAKYGRINAGLIFFALALLSTLILGRWFCGWGCHMVLLQDFCGYLMKKCGVKPVAFRSRLLMYVPLILGGYMFLWPVFYRLAIAPFREQDLEWPGFETRLVTSDFWQTFPGWGMAILILLICGFAAVYFLGAKGFCTYGCPYGGFFAPLDEFSPARIRVTEACEQCGDCTVACTSNVKVHEEVRLYGMVIDPGCMKDLDCVSVCPNNALYFGFGKPAAMKGKPRQPAPPRAYSLSWREEILMGVVFAAIFFSFRGDVARFPLLMATGVALLITFCVYKLERMIRKPKVSLPGVKLKREGRVKGGGIVFVLLTLLTLIYVGQSGVVNLAFLIASHHDDKVVPKLEDVFSESGVVMPVAMQREAQEAMKFYRYCSGIGDGGLGMRTTADTSVRMAWLSCCLGNFDDALTFMSQSMQAGDRPSSRRYLEMALLLEKLDRGEEAARYRELAQQQQDETLGSMRE